MNDRAGRFHRKVSEDIELPEVEKREKRWMMRRSRSYRERESGGEVSYSIK